MRGGHEDAAEEVLAGCVGIGDTHAGSERREAMHSPNRSQRDMNMPGQQPKRPKRNITWQPQPQPAPCEHAYEPITYPLGDAFRRCLKCGNPEAR